MYRIPKNYKEIYTYPSPTELKGKIIIAGKLPPSYNLEVASPTSHSQSLDATFMDSVDRELYEIYKEEEKLEN